MDVNSLDTFKLTLVSACVTRGLAKKVSRLSYGIRQITQLYPLVQTSGYVRITDNRVE